MCKERGCTTDMAVAMGMGIADKRYGHGMGTAIGVPDEYECNTVLIWVYVQAWNGNVLCGMLVLQLSPILVSMHWDCQINDATTACHYRCTVIVNVIVNSNCQRGSLLLASTISERT